ncbi:hypothetical protein C2G38_2196733 [Gigaspora rosea]|uniref:Uncharacterized protein n=1 Tax=Gigaspora rosea TaxID=44941 RepID=A0A397UUN6_9GLOM|nr:hypothetical protein C2G38_2196733 [Gigaspora rosea]
MIELILIETVGIGQFGLKWMDKEFKSLNLINFPNREKELDDILQDFSETVGIGQFGLKWMAKEFKSLNLINFLNQEEELDDILQDFSELPLIKMDLTAFINVTGSGVMHLAGAKSLTFLFLSGTKLTDIGISALKVFNVIKFIKLLSSNSQPLYLYTSVDLENLVESESNFN